MSTDILNGQYPDSWAEYVGQDAAKFALRTMASSANIRGDVLPHTIISSPYAGIGKTALGVLTCRQSGRRILPVSGGMKLADALKMFEDVSDGDIILYDEFHQIANGGPRNYEWLHNYLENGVILTPYGQEEVPRVTFLGMTTDKGILLPAILDKFKHVELEPYNDEEGARIAVHLSSKLMGELPHISTDVAVKVAMAGNNQPRRMRDLIMSLRDLATVGEIAPTDEGDYPLDIALKLAGVTEDGLNKEAVTYLVTLRADFGRAAAGAAQLKARLGYARGDGLKNVEMLLVRKGYIAHTPGGRMLTGDGAKRARALAA